MPWDAAQKFQQFEVSKSRLKSEVLQSAKFKSSCKCPTATATTTASLSIQQKKFFVLFWVLKKFVVKKNLESNRRQSYQLFREINLKKIWNIERSPTRQYFTSKYSSPTSQISLLQIYSSLWKFQVYYKRASILTEEPLCYLPNKWRQLNLFNL